jgi:hypothetical protein
MKSYNGFTPKQRMDAFNWLKKEMQLGSRSKKPEKCDACGQMAGSLMWHSEDYSAPYGAHIGEYGLCYICHMMIHCRFRNKSRWKEYMGNVRRGFKYYHYNFNDWNSFKKEFLGDTPISRGYDIRPDESSIVLDKIENSGNTTSGEANVS